MLFLFPTFLIKHLMKLWKHIFFLFCILSINFTSLAQEETGYVSGTLYDATTGETLIGANVVLKKDPSYGAAADINGKYVVEVPVGKQKLVYSFTGMQSDTISFTITANDTVFKDVSMVPFSEKLDEYEVKVGKFDQKIEDQTVSMEVLKPAIIENKNTRSIETALDATPGLNILDGEPQIRGGSGFTFGVGSKVAVIVDDMPMLSGDAGRPEWGFIPVENIEQIEVIKGASSVLSGSSALSGAIHIRTAYPKNEPTTKVTVYSGLYSAPKNKEQKWWDDYPGIHGMNFLHSQKFGNLDLVIGAHYNYDHGYIGAPRTDEFVKDSVSNFTDKQMASQKGRFNFNLRHRSKRFKGLDYGVNGNIMFNRTNLALAWLNDSTGLYRAYPGAVFLQDHLIFHIDPYINFYSKTGAKHSLRARYLRSDSKMTNNQSTLSNLIYAEYQFKKEYTFWKGLQFIGGLTTQFTDSYAQLYAGSGTPQNQLLNVSGYAQLERKFWDVLNISVGGRAEYFQLNNSKQSFKPIFRTGASLKIMQETYLRASYGQGYRYPTITERFITTQAGSFGVYSNPQLEPETSWNAEVGVKQGLKFGKFFAYFDIAGFWQEYKNTIEYLFGYWSLDFVPGFKFVNTTDTRVLGIDLSFSGFAKTGKNSKITFMAGYNYLSPKTLEPNKEYAEDAFGSKFTYNNSSLDTSNLFLKYRFSHNVKLDIEYSWKGFAIGYSFKYWSNIENLDLAIQQFENSTAASSNLQNIRYMDYYNNHNQGNYVMDARVSYAFKNGMHKIAVIANNFLNRAYSLRPLKIESPRTIMLQYTFKLDKDTKKKDKNS